MKSKPIPIILIMGAIALAIAAVVVLRSLYRSLTPETRATIVYQRVNQDLLELGIPTVPPGTNLSEADVVNTQVRGTEVTATPTSTVTPRPTVTDRPTSTPRPTFTAVPTVPGVPTLIFERLQQIQGEAGDATAAPVPQATFIEDQAQRFATATAKAN